MARKVCSNIPLYFLQYVSSVMLYYNLQNSYVLQIKIHSKLFQSFKSCNKLYQAEQNPEGR